MKSFSVYAMSFRKSQSRSLILAIFSNIIFLNILSEYVMPDMQDKAIMLQPIPNFHLNRVEKWIYFILKPGQEFLKLSKHPPPPPPPSLSQTSFNCPPNWPCQVKKGHGTNNMNYWVKMNFTFYWFWELWGSFLFFFFRFTAVGNW